MPKPKNQARHLSTQRTRPRDAASLVIIKYDDTGPPRILMGRRHANQVFLPNKYVFPGGRIETADSRVATAAELPEVELEKLLLSVPARTSRSRMRALALTAVRETFEETGLIIGGKGCRPEKTTSPGWCNFLQHGQRPDPSCLKFFARAITPPGRPRRFDTRFFWVDSSKISHKSSLMDGELSDLDWITLSEARNRDVADITQQILNDIEAVLSPPSGAAENDPIPFYRTRKNTYERVLLSHLWSGA